MALPIYIQEQIATLRNDVARLERTKSRLQTQLGKEQEEHEDMVQTLHCIVKGYPNPVALANDILTKIGRDGG